MNVFSKAKQIAIIAVGVSALIAQTAFSEQDISQWQIIKGRDGLPAEMKFTYFNKAVNMKMEVLIPIDKNGKPQPGKTINDNGFENRHTERQLDYFWVDRKGIQALWSYWESQNMLTKYNVSDKEFPTNLIGETVRVVLKSGRKLIGTLSEGSLKSDSFSLITRGNTIAFTKSVVSEIQWR